MGSRIKGVFPLYALILVSVLLLAACDFVVASNPTPYPTYTPYPTPTDTAKFSEAEVKAKLRIFFEEQAQERFDDAILLCERVVPVGTKELGECLRRSPWLARQQDFDRSNSGMLASYEGTGAWLITLRVANSLNEQWWWFESGTTPPTQQY